MISKEPWEWSDWYLGVEISLAAFTACCLNACDLYRLVEKAKDTHRNAARGVPSQEVKEERNNVYVKAIEDGHAEQGRNTMVLIFSFLAFFVVGAIHQEWEKGSDNWKKRFVLGLFSNLFGYAPMVCYMMYVKGTAIS